MKIAVVSSSAVPAPTKGYGGLENITGYGAIEMARRGHDVTLITCLGSEIHHMDNLNLPNLTVMETIPPSWEDASELEHYKEYRKYLESEFGTGENSIVWDNTWLAYPYISKKYAAQKMNVVHTHHGMLGFPNAPPVPYPMWMGVSRAHAALMGSQLKIPVRYIHNGINLPPESEVARAKNGGYLLSLNRISAEKGIHHLVDLAIQHKVPLKIVGDDTRVSDQRYVSSIIRRSYESGGLVEYLGLVDDGTKQNLLQNCSAVLGAPEPSWMEAFGLFAVEAMAYGKPVVAVANGGIAEIVENGKSGFLASTPQALSIALPRLGEIKPENCKARAAEFTIEKMVDRYLAQFEKIINEGDRW